MAAFLKTESPKIDGQVTDDGHKQWIEIKSMSSPIFRSIGAEGQRTFSGAFVVSACSRARIIQAANEQRVSVSQQDYHSSV